MNESMECTTLTDKVDVTLRFDQFKSDTEKLKRIIKEMDNYKTTTSDKDGAIRQWKKEFRRRLKASGLSK
jgi:hypothetical protein